MRGYASFCVSGLCVGVIELYDSKDLVLLFNCSVMLGFAEFARK